MTIRVATQLARAQRLARGHRNEEAIALVRHLLNTISGDDSLRDEVLESLAEYQIHYPPARDDVQKTLAQLESSAPVDANLKTLWLRYYAGETEEAIHVAAKLTNEISTWEGQRRVRADLLIGKLCTDSHHLDEARKWLLHGIASARDDGDHHLLAACAGALAEVFYRAGLLQPALELIELDAALLPAGSLHVERLRVYRAHCYRQFGQRDAARGLYHEALQSARLRGFGEPFPARGLLWCDVLEVAELGQDHGQIQRIQRRIDDLRDWGDPHSLGHGLLAAAWVENWRRETARSKALLDEAATVFSEANFHSEATWCRGDDFMYSKRTNIPEAPAFNPPACDQWMASPSIGSVPQRWTKGRDHFAGRSPSDAMAWMGLFF